jgi:hypothetical protein
MSKEPASYEIGEPPRPGLKPHQFYGGELLTNMSDEALSQTYQLLIQLKQDKAASWLARYAREVTGVELPTHKS